jgi:hypothetical protein
MVVPNKWVPVTALQIDMLDILIACRMSGEHLLKVEQNAMTLCMKSSAL